MPGRDVKRILLVQEAWPPALQGIYLCLRSGTTPQLPLFSVGDHPPITFVSTRNRNSQAFTPVSLSLNLAVLSLASHRRRHYIARGHGATMGSRTSTDEGLKFLQQVFGMQMLHLGLFTDETPRDLDGVARAQYEYTRTLIGLIPKGVKTVLDVGCGTGETSKMLIEAGFSPEGLSPDPFHGEKFRETVGPDHAFHLSRFEDLRPGKTYDCLLFSESPQYIDKDAFFPKSLELGGPGSCIVLADFFQLDHDEYYTKAFVERDFRDRAERAGFRVAFHRDVTKEVLPNLDISTELLRYGQRIMRYGEDSFRRSSPVLWKLANVLFRGKIKRAHAYAYEDLPKRVDSARFEKKMRYAMYRLERP